MSATTLGPAAGRARPSARGGPRAAHRSLLGAGATAALGCGLLAARPVIVAATGDGAVVLTALLAGLLAVGAVVRLPAAGAAVRDRLPAAAAVAVGVAAFALGRLLVSGTPPARVGLGFVAANTLAAVAEEVWFRRLCFGLLAPAGAIFAIAGSAVLFAGVHVLVWGWWVLPLDLAAGLLLGWQRHATGSWGAPAITHVLANLFVVL